MAAAATATPLRSLPLMGIGNLDVLPALGEVDHTSLPLMGIGNPRDPIGNDLLVELITPHGDRKHASAAHSILSAPYLITPHGDRKLVCPFSRGKQYREFSLPLMGIGNS